MKHLVILVLVVLLSAAALSQQQIDDELESTLDLNEFKDDHSNHHHRNTKHHERRRQREEGGRRRRHSTWPYLRIPLQYESERFDRSWNDYNTCPERDILEKVLKIMYLLLDKLPTQNAIPGINSRFNYNDIDPIRNWGFNNDNSKKIDYDSYTRRNINLEPQQETERRPKKTSGPSLFVTENPLESRKPGICELAYLACCDLPHRTTCVQTFSCEDSFNEQNCYDKRFREDIQHKFSSSYGLSKED